MTKYKAPKNTWVAFSLLVPCVCHLYITRVSSTKCVCRVWICSFEYWFVRVSLSVSVSLFSSRHCSIVHLVPSFIQHMVGWLTNWWVSLSKYVWIMQMIVFIVILFMCDSFYIFLFLISYSFSLSLPHSFIHCIIFYLPYTFISPVFF